MKDHNADTVRTSIIREAAMFLARMWKQHIYPVPFSSTFYLDGIRVHISVEEYQEGEKKE